MVPDRNALIFIRLGHHLMKRFATLPLSRTCRVPGSPRSFHTTRWCDYISATQASTGSSGVVLSHVTVTWLSGAAISRPGPVSTAHTLASVDKDKPQPCLT